MFFLILINFLFSLTYPLITICLNESTILTTMAIRMLFGGLSLFIFQIFYDFKQIAIKKKHILSFLIICLFHMFLNFIAEAYALKHLSGFIISIFYLTSPLISAIIGKILYNTFLSKKQKYILFLFFLISFLYLFQINLNLNLDYFNLKSFISILLIIFSISSSILSWYKIKELIEDSYSIVVINGYASLFSGFFSFIIGYFFDQNFFIIGNKLVFYKSILLLVIVSNFLAYNLYQNILKKYSITFIMLIEFIAPFFVAILEWLFFGIYINIYQLIYFFIFLFLIYKFNKK